MTQESHDEFEASLHCSEHQDNQGYRVGPHLQKQTQAKERGIASYKPGALME